MRRDERLSWFALALCAVGAVVGPALVAPVPAGPVEQVDGRPADGTFDLEAARVARQVLVERLGAEMPRAAAENRIRVEVTERELVGVGQLEEGRLRVGVVKALGEPVLFTGRDPVSARGLRGSGTAGVTEASADGGFVWAVTVDAPGATAVRLHFTGFALAPSTELYIHTPGGEAFGPYTGLGPLGSGEFWSHSVAGETVIVQLRQTGNRVPVRASSSFTLGEIGYMDLSKVGRGATPDPQVGEQLCGFNAACVENANCNSIPAAIQNARDAYAHMEFVSGGFLYYCSGGLIADAAATATPYFLTANHCISRSSEASSLQAFFQYEVACNGSCPALYFYNQTPPPFPRTVGATIRATNKTSDYTLLQLSQPAPSGSAFLGWNKTAVANSNGTALYRISHPGGAPQAYSTHSVNTSKGTCRSWPRGAWIYSEDTLGATEGGSSGSPVLNASGQVVGQLSGACGTNVNDNCDAASNATVDGAFANYFCSVQPFLAPADTSCGGGGGCKASGSSCTTGSECCSGSCKGKPGSKTCG